MNYLIECELSGTVTSGLNGATNQTTPTTTHPTEQETKAATSITRTLLVAEGVGEATKTLLIILSQRDPLIQHGRMQVVKIGQAMRVAV